MRLEKMLHNGRAETGPSQFSGSRQIHTVKTLAQMRDTFRRNANPVVFDPDTDPTDVLLKNFFCQEGDLSPYRTGRRRSSPKATEETGHPYP